MKKISMSTRLRVKAENLLCQVCSWQVLVYIQHRCDIQRNNLFNDIVKFIPEIRVGLAGFIAFR